VAFQTCSDQLRRIKVKGQVLTRVQALLRHSECSVEVCEAFLPSQPFCVITTTWGSTMAMEVAELFYSDIPSFKVFYHVQDLRCTTGQQGTRTTKSEVFSCDLRVDRDRSQTTRLCTRRSVIDRLCSSSMTCCLVQESGLHVCAFESW
jgi:hypothetical protein